MSSNLVISGLNLPASSIRGASQTLEPIEQTSQTRRTINGVLVDISNSDFRKYRSTITCQDQLPPAFNNIWPGSVLVVSCISELCYLTSGGSASKTVVSGSSRIDGAYTFYRPQLTMMLKSFNWETDEFGANVSWSLDLEEI